MECQSNFLPAIKETPVIILLKYFTVRAYTEEQGGRVKQAYMRNER